MIKDKKCLCDTCEHSEVCRHKDTYLAIVNGVKRYLDDMADHNDTSFIKSVETRCGYYIENRPVLREKISYGAVAV